MIPNMKWVFLAILVAGAAGFFWAKSGFELFPVGEGTFNFSRQEFVEGLKKMPVDLEEARVIPNITPQDKVEGFQILEIGESSFFNSMFQKGDILKKVNGEAIDSPARAIELYEEFMNKTGTLTLELERNGKPITLTVNVTP